ncbi:sugar kinase [Thalassotalea insulae]|uniref:Sugar kinase n=1 Tax=Thalassotalea insulae TaxID=2056778 RepID=A0ABQ6GS66_9GAMM|nr:ROK family protein [Thalassotalea insulae]GLX78798.1 sugar kinase [Thalassotalea insulae]
MNTRSIIVLDIGGTKINFGRFQGGMIQQNQILPFPAHASAEEIFAFIIHCIDLVKLDDTEAIAIGVPCIVDIEQGIVFNAVNIPAWQQYPLKSLLQAHYQLPVYINNDVNCFVAGESAYGTAKHYQNVAGICLGTGFGCGLFVNQQLYAGQNCCAGEVGGIRYLDATIDDYCSGQYFIDHYQVSGAELAQRADAGDVRALAAFEQFAGHLANAISHLLLVIDPQVIVIGGSVANSYHLFIDALWRELANFPYPVVIENLTICQSELADAALLGAASLYLHHHSEIH